MAIPTNIRTLLMGNVVEWERIEFKTTWDPEASLKTITAFANDLENWGGGYIVLGVKDKDGMPLRPHLGVPLDKVDAWKKVIYEKCKMIRPGYTPIIGTDELDGKTFVSVKSYKLSGTTKRRQMHYIPLHSSPNYLKD